MYKDWKLQGLLFGVLVAIAYVCNEFTFEKIFYGFGVLCFATWASQGFVNAVDYLLFKTRFGSKLSEWLLSRGW